MKNAHKHLTHSVLDSDDEAFRMRDLLRDSGATDLAVEVIEKAQTGEDRGVDDLNEQTIEELGGPFVETDGDEEYAIGVDRSNPEDATREAFPKT